MQLQPAMKQFIHFGLLIATATAVSTSAAQFKIGAHNFTLVVKTAPNRENAILFLEYLAGDSAQRYFTQGNNEWPAVPSTPLDNPALNALGKFRQDTQNVSTFGKNQPNAQKILDRAGWK